MLEPNFEEADGLGICPDLEKFEHKKRNRSFAIGMKKKLQVIQS